MTNIDRNPWQSIPDAYRSDHALLSAGGVSSREGHAPLIYGCSSRWRHAQQLFTRRRSSRRYLEWMPCFSVLSDYADCLTVRLSLIRRSTARRGARAGWTPGRRQRLGMLACKIPPALVEVAQGIGQEKPCQRDSRTREDGESGQTKPAARDPVRWRYPARCS